MAPPEVTHEFTWCSICEPTKKLPSTVLDLKSFIAIEKSIPSSYPLLLSQAITTCWNAVLEMENLVFDAKHHLITARKIEIFL
jgi:hypothetical protein